MPTVYYVNPSRRRRKKVATGKTKRRPVARRKATTGRPRPSAAAKKRAATKRKSNPKKRTTRKTTARRKTTRKKTTAARSARKGTTMRKKRRSVKRRKPAATRRKRNPSTKRKAAARKAAATRKRKAAARSRAAKKAARTRKRRTYGRKRNAAPKRRRRTTTRRKRNAAPKRRRRATTRRRRRRNPAPIARRRRRTVRRRRRRNPSQTRGLVALSKGRRAYHNRKRKGRGLTRHYVKKHNIRMKNNPASMMDAVKMALPIAASLYGGKFLTTKLVGVMPEAMRSSLRDVGGFNMQKPVAALAVFGAGFYGTKKLKGKAGKMRPSIVLGLGINVVDAFVCTFAPGDVCGTLGVKSEETSADADAPSAASDYVQVGEYMGIGNVPPIDDDITLADYVEIGDLEADLGALESELGLSAELGAEEDLGRVGGFANRHLGGVHRNEMLKQIPSARMTAPVPARSFVGKVPHAGQGFDADSRLYTGIFGGGFG